LPDGQVAMYLLSQRYLDALPLVTQGKGTTIFLPAEAAGVMGALGGLRELLRAAGHEQQGAAPEPTRPASTRPALTGGSQGRPTDSTDKSGG
jgi:hypothetical protein